MESKSLDEECPVCYSDLRGAVVPNTDPPQYFSRLIGVEISGVYDGILYYECPFCQARFHRFREGTDLWHRAARYV